MYIDLTTYFYICSKKEDKIILQEKWSSEIHKTIFGQIQKVKFQTKITIVSLRIQHYVMFLFSPHSCESWHQGLLSHYSHARSLSRQLAELSLQGEFPGGEGSAISLKPTSTPVRGEGNYPHVSLCMCVS